MSLPMCSRSRLPSKQKTWTRLPELPASNMTAYFFAPAAPPNGPDLLPAADGAGARGMRRSTRETSASGARTTSRTPR
uniref:Uncharacterized protein n=1 Tax=Arundo donax TaxID=35708 RepID=A0A0A9CVK6_ARUDO